MQIEDQWETIRQVFWKAYKYSFHCAIASVNEDGSPHITPIGSLILVEPGRGFFFEAFTVQLPRNLERDPRICAMAVDSSPFLWARALLGGRFPVPPSVRLMGVVGPRQRATAKEIGLWKRRIRFFRFMKGYGLMWADKYLKYVRYIDFDTFEPADLRAMTRHLAARRWKI